MSEPHEVVTLLLKRMKSHPEEFRVADAPFHDRWYDHVNSIQAFGSEADKAAMAEGLREIRLAETHERVMDELLNGEERRRKVFEEQEYERNLSKSLLLTKQQAMQQQMQQMQQYQNAVGQLGVYDVDRDMYRSAGVTHIAGQSPNSLPIANGSTGATLGSTLGKLKKLVRR
jgi:hypothetical protein